MGIELNLSKFTNSYYIPVYKHIKEQLGWTEKTPLDLSILPIMDKQGNIVSSMIVVTEKNIVNKLERKVMEIK